ncbi:NACHT domain-containing protein [Streptomyces otsuchiensis]|uniref:NACHT domain-containing protein n=1 Tax=Streptomyces otsuchiensis TaxID=2681388 RepID=UPI0010303D5D|nr:NACHT domain-containing protein [Streptomyces otsuchiensis]
MDAANIGLRLASSAVTPLVKSLFHREEPGAGLVDRPVRISSLLSCGGERDQRRTLDEKRLRTLTVELVDRAARARGPHEAPGAEVRREVADALTRSLAALGELSMDDVQAVALGADGLARRVRRPGGLSAEADSLYDPLLRVVCLHILNHFTRRSTFVARSLVEQTRRCESIVARLDTLAARVPSQPMADAAFEDRYRRYIVNEHDRLMIHGIDADGSWPLDDAYLSLETTTAAETRAPQERDLSATSLPPTPRRAEDALSGRPRVLLRGNAGSGKTTLLQWLAVTAARQRMDGDSPIQAQLLGLVPFVLPLRRLTRHDRELPPPSALLSAVGCPHTPPEGWTERVLGAGQGLLLVDGIDEVPENEREDVRRWLRSLVREFGGNLWVVTARPSAVGHDWLAEQEFTDLSLAPMSRDDTATFVRRWHTAARVAPETADELLDALRTRPDLARLATAPLMCGLICALHHTRHGYLPRGREALYQAGLHMLLERRNQERKVRSTIELDATTQILLLQRLAYWLIRNGRAEMDRDDAVEILADALPGMSQVAEQGDEETIYRYLLDRSGLLREPASGVVDFVHRTFQDYLAAKAAVEARDIPFLVSRAHLDQFEDVIRMAVAHGRPGERDRLLKQLVQRGDKVARHRIRLHLLAVACLEHATELSPAVRDLVTDRARDYLPPRTYAEAESLAAAGPVALDLLPGPDGLSGDEMRAVIDTARLVGTDRALPVLRRFRSVENRAVAARLLTCWRVFDPDRFSEEIVSHLPPHEYHFVGWNSRVLELIAAHGGVRHLLTWVPVEPSQLRALLAYNSIVSLDLHGSPLDDLGILSAADSLEQLTLSEKSARGGLAPLRDRNLSRLYLYCAKSDADPRILDGLAELSTLEDLALGEMTPLASLEQLPLNAPLKRLSLPATAPDVSAIIRWPGLCELDLTEYRRPLSEAECRALAALPELDDFRLRPAALRSLHQAGVTLPGVTFAQLVPRRKQPHSRDELALLATVFPALETLYLSPELEDPSPLGEHPRLETVNFLSPVTRQDFPPNLTVTAPPSPRY